MIKIIGVIILISSSTFVGSVLGNRVKLRVEELIYLKKLLVMFRGELEYKNAMLPEAFLAVSNRAKAPYDNVFNELAVATEDNCTVTMARIFEGVIDKCLKGKTHLKNEDLYKLYELGDTLGYQNKTMQLSNVDLFLDRLNVQIQEEREKMNDTVKVYRTMSVMTGIFVAIILL